MSELQLVLAAGSTLLEGPEWNSNRQCISCVSIEQGIVYVIYEKTGIVDSFDIGSQIGCAVWTDADHLMVAAYDGIVSLNVENGSREYIDNILPNKSIRYNDGKLDPRGRFFIGTTGYKRFAENECCLYSYMNGERKTLIENVSISNGIGFSPDNQYMYYIDTPTGKVGKYNYNVETGEVSFDKYVVDVVDGMPDGMCTDREGMLWVAQWNGFGLSRWNPETGEKIGEIKVPVMNVTSCCLGGENMDYLYITTAKHDDESESEIMAGSLFKYKL